MTATAPQTGHIPTPDRVTVAASPSGSPNEDFHPDVLAWAATQRHVSLARLREMQRRYDAEIARRIAAEDQSPVITLEFRGGSHNADREGDRTARRIDRERTRE